MSLSHQKVAAQTNCIVLFLKGKLNGSTHVFIMEISVKIESELKEGKEWWHGGYKRKEPDQKLGGRERERKREREREEDKRWNVFQLIPLGTYPASPVMGLIDGIKKC